MRLLDSACVSRKALIQFAERSQSFDFTVALQDWTRRRKSALAGSVETDPAAPSHSPHLPTGPKQNFSLQDGETIHISIPGQRTASHRDASETTATSRFVLPPPPGRR